MIKFWKFWLENRKADFELDQLGKLILGAILLIILIFIITVVIKGGLDGQGEKIKDVFSGLK